MSGLVKQKEYKVADSNIANLGSDLEREVKKAAAETEQAWQGCGQKAGLEIWRIEKFKVIHWPKEEYGNFFSGDSYIVLSTKEKDDPSKKTKVFRGGQWVEKDSALEWDIHFWLGKYTTQDEAGTAAYKTVELDDFLDQAPVQHREVQEHESDDFMALFGGKINVMEGGVDSGFKHVKPEEYRPRLLHVKGNKNVRVAEVPLAVDSLNHGDVFIIDAGLKIIQWNGNKSSISERRKAAEIRSGICEERHGKPKARVDDDGAEDDDFWEILGGKDSGRVKEADEVEKDADFEKGFEKKLFRLSDASGEMKFTEEAKGTAVKMSLLDTNDVFVFDAGHEVFVWMGLGATEQERKKGLGYAQDYLTKFNRPAYLPITRVMEGGETGAFKKSF
jgi:gelsolin